MHGRFIGQNESCDKKHALCCVVYMNYPINQAVNLLLPHYCRNGSILATCLQHLPGKFDMKFVTRLKCNHMPNWKSSVSVGSKQRHIAYQVQHLVPDRLVTVTQRRILKVGAPGNEGIHRGAAPDEAGFAGLLSVFKGGKGARLADVVSIRLVLQRAPGVRLLADGRALGREVNGVRDAWLILWVQHDERLPRRHHNRLRGLVRQAISRLALWTHGGHHATIRDAAQPPFCRAVQHRQLGPLLHFDARVVHAARLQSRQDVFYGGDGDVAGLQLGAQLKGLGNNVVQGCRDAHLSLVALHRRLRGRDLVNVQVLARKQLLLARRPLLLVQQRHLVKLQPHVFEVLFVDFLVILKSLLLVFDVSFRHKHEVASLARERRAHPHCDWSPAVQSDSLANE
mmetsp:Transcript_4582/g.8631  ORF Transcript_4582/g.8631 Transcript_4582/m.8631 type:complete len:397 (+) Transcript_4582:131-1321(+)